MRSPPKRAGWKAGTIAVAALGGLVRLTGCHSDNTSADMTTINDMGTTVTPGVPPTSATSVTTADRPLAAVVTPDGQTVYLTAHDTSGLAQLYSVPVAGGSPTLIATTTQLAHPLSMAISPSGQTLYFADSAGGKVAGNEDAGAVYSSNIGGSISANYDGVRAPSGVAVSADGNTLYVTGFDKANGKPGVFSVSASGGTATAFAEGPPFVNPSAVTVGTDGSVYVVDSTALGTGLAAVIQVKDGAASVFNKSALKVGFASGIAQVGPGSTDLLITGTTAGLGTGVVYQLTAPGGIATQLSLGTTVTMFDPATIARAGNANVWVVVDTVNASQPTPGKQLGSIYKLATGG